jgi:hypothetical protein
MWRSVSSFAVEDVPEGGAGQIAAKVVAAEIDQELVLAESRAHAVLRTAETLAAESGLIPGEVDYSREASYVRDVTGTRRSPGR